MTTPIEKASAVIRTARRVLALTGAGMSAESGVPTFRGGGGALVWRGMPFETLSSAQMVRDDLSLVWEWFDYRRSVLATCKPNAGHVAMAKAGSAGKFEWLAVVTQNIDNLHTEAGSKNVVELHGNIHEARCSFCGLIASLFDISADERPPACPSCTGRMRPNVVLFGEMLSQASVDAGRAAAASCDVCITIGTSGLVSPANLLPSLAKASDAVLIEVNPEETILSATADISIRGYSADVLRSMFDL